MNSFKEYILPIPEDDFNNGFKNSKKIANRVLTKLMRRLGSIKFKLTIDALMKKEGSGESRKAGFRSKLTSVAFVEDVQKVLQDSFNKLEESIMNYNKNGMSCCLVQSIKVKILVIRYVI